MPVKAEAVTGGGDRGLEGVRGLEGDRGFGDHGLEGDRAPARSEMVTGGTGGLEGADRGRSRPRLSPAEQIEATSSRSSLDQG